MRRPCEFAADAVPRSDLLEIAGEWLGNLGAGERFTRLCGLLGKSDLAPRVKVVACVTSGYEGFFDYSKTLSGCEGIVLKRADSKFIGSVRKCVDNPLWLKVKWRVGAEGHTLVA